MRVPLSWLRDFVDPHVTPATLAADLTMIGLAMDAMEEVGDDWVIDLDVTANRPDCLSVLGVAHEVAAYYDLPLREPPVRSSASGPSADTLVAVDLEDATLCPRYAARVVEAVPAASPAWLTRRLDLAGTRPINAIVDVTNYVLYELGQPLHAFDLDRLEGRRLVIRRARPGERLVTLDGTDRALEADMLVIADAARPQAIGGVMGGAASEVTGRTRTIVLESAYFLPASIRRTSRRLGLKTEASARFERGANLEAQVRALDRACALIEQISAGTPLPGVIDRYPVPPQAPVLELRLARARALIGVALEAAFVEGTLPRLGFGLEAGGGGDTSVRPAPPTRPTREAADIGADSRRWRITVPPHRVDVTREIDLIEELARMYGYGRIPPTLPATAAGPVALPPELRGDRLVREALTGAGFSEAVTLAFTEQAADAPFAGPGGSVPIVNPLSEKFAVLRSSLLASLIDAVAWNLNHQIENVRLFELAERFHADGAPVGTRALAVALCGAAAPASWSGKPRPVDLFDAKGALEAVLGRLGVHGMQAEPEAVPFLVPGRSGLLRAGDRRLGVFGQLRPAIAQARAIEAALFVGELDLAAVYACIGPEPAFEPLPRFPATVRDVAVLVDEGVAAATVLAAIRESAPPFLTGLEVFDLYRGKEVAPGRVSLAFRLTYRAADRTLTDTEVASAHEAIVAHLEETLGAKRR